VLIHGGEISSEAAMRSLLINLDDVVMAMDNAGSFELHNFLDKQTGEIVMISDEFYDEDEDLDEEADQEAELPDWQRKEIETARKIMNDTEGRFEEIPANRSGESYHLMEEFIDTVREARPRDLLLRAIDSRGAFRRFKDTLFEFPELREQWFKFESERNWEWAREWLESIGLKSTWVPPKQA
jgi:hypothetical protein